MPSLERGHFPRRLRIWSHPKKNTQRKPEIDQSKYLQVHHTEINCKLIPIGSVFVPETVLFYIQNNNLCENGRAGGRSTSAI